MGQARVSSADVAAHHASKRQQRHRRRAQAKLNGSSTRARSLVLLINDNQAQGRPALARERGCADDQVHSACRDARAQFAALLREERIDVAPLR